MKGIKDVIGSFLDETGTGDRNPASPPTTVVTKGVVLEVLSDLAGYGEKELAELNNLLTSATSGGDDAEEIAKLTKTGIEQAPRNALLVYVVSYGEGKRRAYCRLCYPFFPPHLCFPVKPGEQVWLIEECPEAGSTILYWMCRVPEPVYVDDINYTHGDRKFTVNAPGTGALATKKDVETDAGARPLTFGFPNGNQIKGVDDYTFSRLLKYEEIVRASKAYQDFTPEVVPRLTKRPGDFVIQGSNNAAIILGQDRGWVRKDVDDKDRNDPVGKKQSNASKTDNEIISDKNQPCGTIDAVVGRGRYTFQLLSGKVDDAPALTSAATVNVTPPKENGREPYTETLKNPAGMKLQAKNATFNPTEGDPDFDNDAARLYLSMASDVDKNFYIDQPGKNIPSPFEGDDFKPAVGPAGTASPPPANNPQSTANYTKPAVLLGKSDEIRLIARNKKADEPIPKAPKINGSIRLIKEGDPKEDLASIGLFPKGTVQISGKKIFLGRSESDRTPDEKSNPYGGPGPGPGKSQPFVKYSDLVRLFEQLFEVLEQVGTDLNTTATPGFGSPDPGSKAAAITLSTKLGEIKTASQQFKALGSSRIFGE